jgi:hypothetical protein
VKKPRSICLAGCGTPTQHSHDLCRRCNAEGRPVDPLILATLSPAEREREERIQAHTRRVEQDLARLRKPAPLVTDEAKRAARLEYLRSRGATLRRIAREKKAVAR